jgi:formylglycine-generating enzyme required for sulfatase activity
MKRSFALGSLVTVAALGCGGGAPVAQSQVPSVEGADAAAATCKPAKDPLNPLIVEWPGTNKVDLDAASQGGVVVVSYVGCVLKVLRWCQAGGGYKLQTVTPVRDKVSVANESELYAKLPLAVASLKAELSTAGQLDLEYVAVGQRVADRTPAALGGDCPGATHYVRSITVGAYSLDASGKAAASASAEAGDKGARADHKEQVHHVRGSGDMAGCEKNAKSGGCDAVLQLGLAPLPGYDKDFAATAVVPMAQQPPGGRAAAGSASGGGEATGGMARIPGGTFMMGSESGDADEKPVHSVTVGAFSMDVNDVTVAAYAACVKAGRCSEPGTGDDCNWGKSDRPNHPITCVDWNQSTAYCAYAGKRLPTEEEWEYAARGTDERTYPWGNEAPSNQLCWHRWASKEGTCVVGSHPSGASPFGLQDMAGNVWQWTSSNYCPYPGNKCAEAARVFRGGSWGSGDAAFVRGALRRRYAPSLRYDFVGFRCARAD